MKRKLVALSLVMALAATTAACGAGASNNTPASSSNNETAAPAEDGADAAADAEVESSDLEVTGDSRTLSLFAGSIPENTPTGVGLEVQFDT